MPLNKQKNQKEINNKKIDNPTTPAIRYSRPNKFQRKVGASDQQETLDDMLLEDKEKVPKNLQNKNFWLYL